MIRVFDEKRVGELISARETDRQAELVRLVAESGAVLDNHFALASGAHAQYFLRFRSLGADPARAQQIASEILATKRVPFDGVTLVAPESAGFFLADALRRQIGASVAVLSTDARRRPGDQLRPPSALSKGTRVVLVNDVATTGRSLEMLKAQVEAHEASVVGVVLFAVLGSKVREPLQRWKVPSVWLVEPTWPTYEADRCPLCEEGKGFVLSLELA